MNRRENPDTGSGKSSAGSPARKRILFWAKVAVSALVLFLVLRSADLSRTFGFIASSRKGLWLTALALLLLSQAVSTFRWHTLLQPLDFNLPWPRVFRIYFVGMFFSLFLPTVIGGDGVKAFYVSQGWKRVPAALYTLLADRSVGLAAMSLFAVLGLPATRGAWPPWLGTTVVLGTVGLYAVLLFLPRLSAPALALSRRLREMPAERLFVYWEKPSAAGGAWLLSLLVHLCVLAAHVSLSAALGLGVPAAAWLVIYPVTSFVAFLPVSLNGVGPREAAYIYLIGLMGVGREQALSLGIMWFSLVLASGLVGGAFYLFGGELRVTDAVRT